MHLRAKRHRYISGTATACQSQVPYSQRKTHNTPPSDSDPVFICARCVVYCEKSVQPHQSDRTTSRCPSRAFEQNTILTFAPCFSLVCHFFYLFLFHFVFQSNMSRGDQRDRDRAKNLAKLQAKTKALGRVRSTTSENETLHQKVGVFLILSLHFFLFFVLQPGDPLQRNSSDAAALEAKIAEKKAKQEQETAIQAGAVAPVVRKKVPTMTKKDSVDDLLSAGLSSTSKVKRAK